MKTLLIITPHMSTGGCPQIVVKKVELFKDFYNIVVIEWDCLAWNYVVQRNKVIDLIDLQDGVYFIHVHVGELTYIRKVIKQ